MPRIQLLNQSETETNSNETQTEISRAVIGELVPVQDFKDIGDALKFHGAGINDIAECIGNTLKYGDSHGVKLQAAKMAAEFIGIGSTKESNQVTIVVKDSNVNLGSIFNPQR